MFISFDSLSYLVVLCVIFCFVGDIMDLDQMMQYGANLDTWSLFGPREIRIRSLDHKLGQILPSPDG